MEIFDYIGATIAYLMAGFLYTIYRWSSPRLTVLIFLFWPLFLIYEIAMMIATLAVACIRNEWP